MLVKLKRFTAALLAGLMTLTMLPAYAFAAATLSEDADKTDLILTYDTAPAYEDLDLYNTWEQYGLATGNGGIGGSVFGGVQRERINLNEKSLWSGGPSESRPDYNGGNISEKGQNGLIFRQVQQLFNDGKIDEAIALCNTYLVGTKTGYGYYLNYGDMNFEFDYADAEYSNYKRTLNLRTGVITVEYDVNGVHYVRETFTSYPDNVIVTNIKTTGGNLGFDLAIAPDNEVGEDTISGNSNTDYTRTWTTTVADGTISVEGTLDDNGLQFASHSKVITNGTLTENTETVTVSEATEATVITSIGTDYKNVYPDYRTEETMEEVSSRVGAYVTKASAQSYDTLKQTHIADYDEIFGRVDFELTKDIPDMSTEELIDAYNAGTATLSEKNYLEMLLFQFGRYLSIEGSRETPEDDPSRVTLPTNLQGMWVGANNSAWHSDYHFNINLQMNYWPAYVTNMVETAEPLIDYIESIREPGRITAAIYAGIESTEENPENGFMVHTQNTPYGYTCPGYSFSWGWSTSAVAWILQNCWEHYEYTGDLEYMREKIYPMLKETAVFYDQYLVEDNDGYLVSSPAYSPEHGPYTAGNTYEHALIWQLYEDTITAAELLGLDADKVKTWKSNQSRLKGPVEIGEDGQIKEWYEETTLGSVDDFEAKHRHLSNLIGLFPGDYISTETPELFEAAKVSLEERGDASTGWSSSSGWSVTWRALCWSRLGDGDKAYDLLDYSVLETMPNLYSSYPPFQIDGVYGYTAAVAEMLMQSNAGYISLLPAISEEWADGSVSGLLARGNFEVSMDWTDEKLNTASILSNNGGTATVEYDKIAFAKVTDSKGNEVKTKGISLDRISFETTEGETYTITQIPATEKAPENLTAERIGDAGVSLEWDALEAADATYNVYRQVTFGETQLIARGLTETTYTDTETSELLEGVKYQVSAVIGDDETALSNSAEMEFYPTAGMLDDCDSRIIYTAGTNGKNFNKENYPAGHQYYQPELYEITCHNIAAANTAGQTVELTFVGTGIEVIVVKYSNRGYMNATIDGVDVGICDTYSNAGPVIYGESGLSVTDLEYGKHTLKLTVPEGTKAVQIDAFRILDSNKTMPETVEITPAVDTNVISKVGGSLQLNVNVGPDAAADKSVKWSSSDETIVTVDSNGLVTANSKNGTATVTAKSNMDASVYDTFDVTVLLQEYEEIVIDESIKMPDAVATAMNKTGSATIGKNYAIVWSDTGWGSPYTGEPTKHYGTRKTSGSPGATFEYTFTGTGIQIICQKTKLQGGFEITLDGVDMGTYSLYTSASDGEAQSIIFEDLNLDFGVHTVKGTAVAIDGREQINLDAIKVYMPKNKTTSNFSTETVDTSPDAALSSDMIFDSNWWTYSEDGLYGGSKCEQRYLDRSVEYTFEGTGIRVIADTSCYYDGYQVYIDGEDMGVADLYSTSTSVSHQQTVYENTDLADGEHTIKLVTVKTSGQQPSTEGGWNIDAFEVLRSEDTPVYTYETPYTYYEESITSSDGYTGTANPAFTWSGKWGSNVGYWKEPFQHHGYRKRDASPTATVEFTFTGTGIQLGAQKNTAYAGYQIWIDGVDYGEYSLKDTVKKDQQIIFSKLDLPKGQHTIKAQVISMNSSTTANLDYLCVYNYDTAPEVIDKSALYNLITSTGGFEQSYYAADKWSAYELALSEAITVSENGDAKQTEIDSAASALSKAIEALGTPDVLAPDTDGCTASVLHIEGNRAIITWDAADKAAYYVVSVNGETQNVYATKLDTMATLTPETAYTAEIYPVATYQGIEKMSEQPITVSFTTLDTVAPELEDFELEQTLSNPVVITWNESADAQYYNVYLDGVKNVSTENSYNFGELETDRSYQLIIEAADANGNTSAPIIKTFTVSETVNEFEWSYDAGSGALTVSGVGAMPDFEPRTAPWIEAGYQNNIYSVVVEEGITEIGDWAFSYLYYARTVNLPESLESIGINAFYQCANLEEAIIPENTGIIGGGAFAYCKKLASVSVPVKVTAIESYTFYDCEKLEKVYYNASEAQWNALTKKSNNDALSDVALYDETLAGTTWSFDETTGTLTIGGYARMENYNAKETPWYDYANDIKKIVVEEGVTGLGNWAFSYCFYVTEIVLPETLVHIGAGAFYNCSSLTSIELPGGLTRLFSGAFYNCKKLASITIPVGIDTVYANTFLGCSSLAEVSFNGTKVQWEKVNVLSNNTELTDLEMNCLVKSIEWTLSEDGTLTVSGGVPMDDYELKTAPMAPWADVKTDIKKVVIEDGITNIGNNAFYGCTNLTEVVIPDSVTSIGYGAFWACYGLESIVIPEGVDYIGVAAFYACSALKEITISSTVTSILAHTFYNCVKLSTVNYGGDIADLNITETNNNYFISAIQ